ncbi:MAG: hypothetical protein ACOVQF_02995 [Brevundimonas sp.]
MAQAEQKAEILFDNAARQVKSPVDGPDLDRSLVAHQGDRVRGCDRTVENEPLVQAISRKQVGQEFGD